MCPCFLILLLQLPTLDYSCPAGEQLAMTVSCALLSAIQTPDQQDLYWSSYIMLQLLQSFPTFPLLPLNNLCKPSPSCLLKYHGTFSQYWTLALEEFLSSASYSLMKYNWASISNPLPHRIFPNLLIRMPQCWPGWSSEIAVQFCCWRILTLETSNASAVCINLKFVFLVCPVKNRPGNEGLV